MEGPNQNLRGAYVDFFRGKLLPKPRAISGILEKSNGLGHNAQIMD